jgi:hypothetical protein
MSTANDTILPFPLRRALYRVYTQLDLMICDAFRFRKQTEDSTLSDTTQLNWMARSDGRDGQRTIAGLADGGARTGVGIRTWHVLAEWRDLRLPGVQEYQSELIYLERRRAKVQRSAFPLTSGSSIPSSVFCLLNTPVWS